MGQATYTWLTRTTTECWSIDVPVLMATPTPSPSPTPRPTPSPTATPSTGAQTSVIFDSEPGDYIGAGQQLIFKDLCTACFSVGSSSPSFFEFRLDSQGHGFFIDFEALQGSPLVPGTYEGAARYPFNSPDQPGLSIFGDGRGCNTLTGRFVVQEAVFSNGAWVRFSASFEQHCEGGTPALFGEVRFNSGVPLHPLGSAPSSVFFGSVPIGTTQSSFLDVANTGFSPLSISSVSVGGAHAGDFMIESDGCQGNVVGVGANCRIHVRFAPSAVGYARAR